VIKLRKTIASWNTPEFEDVFRAELEELEHGNLPLQQGLARSSYVSDSKISAVLINYREQNLQIIIKAGIFYHGINAGSCCADDPTPVGEEAEYCEMQFEINSVTGDAIVSIVS